MSRKEVNKAITELLRERIIDELKWIDDVERKSSTMLASIGVVLALLVPLLGILFKIIIEKSDGKKLIYVPFGDVLNICVILYVIVIIILGVSLFFAYKVYSVEKYKMPSIDKVVSMAEIGSGSTIFSVYENQIGEMDESRKHIKLILEKKSKYLSYSQKLFVIGIFSLIILLIVTLIEIII